MTSLQLKTVLILLLTCRMHSAGAQNLLANPSFEDVNICTERNAPCTPAAWESVAPEHQRMDYAYHTYPGNAGNNVLKLIMSSTNSRRNYAQTQLLCPLVPGRKYRISIVAFMDNGEVPFIGVRFDTTYVFTLMAVKLDKLSPDLEFNKQDVTRTVSKKFGIYRMEKEFTVPAQRTHMILGDFSTQAEYSRNLNILIDSISLHPVEAEALCPSAAIVNDTLYAQHRRHTIPTEAYKKLVADKPKTELDRRGCVSIFVRDEQIFHIHGRAKYPEIASRLDSLLRVYTPESGTKITVNGYADRQGTDQYNKIVSSLTAQRIMDALIQRHGFTIDDVEAYGQGRVRMSEDTLKLNMVGFSEYAELVFCRPQKNEPSGRLPLPLPPKPDTLVVPDVLFKFDSSQLNPELYKALDSLISKIPKNDTTQLQLQGYTDDVGSVSYNLDLSRRRAVAVAEYLRDKGLGKYIRHVSGEGENFPVAPNTTKEGRSMNRRVEIIIYHNLE